MTPLIALINKQSLWYNSMALILIPGDQSLYYSSQALYVTLLIALINKQSLWYNSMALILIPGDHYLYYSSQHDSWWPLSVLFFTAVSVVYFSGTDPGTSWPVSVGILHSHSTWLSWLPWLINCAIGQWHWSWFLVTNLCSILQRHYTWPFWLPWLLNKQSQWYSSVAPFLVPGEQSL